MKKNIRKIPQAMLNRIHSFELDDIVVACIKRLKPEDFVRYASLGVRFTDGALTVPQPLVPKATAGSYSKANVEGKDILEAFAEGHPDGFVGNPELGRLVKRIAHSFNHAPRVSAGFPPAQGN